MRVSNKYLLRIGTIQYNYQIQVLSNKSLGMSIDLDKEQSYDPYTDQYGCGLCFTLTESQFQQHLKINQCIEDDSMMDEDQYDNEGTNNATPNEKIQTPRQKRPLPRQRNQRNSKRRDGNSIASNASRDFKHSIKLSLKSKGCLYQKFLKWIQENKIISQIWAFDALCFNLLFLRDRLQILSSKVYIKILKNFKSKLDQTLEYQHDQASIRKIQCYQLHVQEYLKPSFSFSMIPQFLGKRSRYFDGLVKKRTQTKQKCVLKLKEIYAKLNSEKGSSKTDLETNHLGLECQEKDQKSDDLI